MTGGFQTSVNTVPAVGVAGDYASVNPVFSFDAGPGGLVAGPSGVNTGCFAWITSPTDANGQSAVVNNSGSGPVAGFVHRAQQALITAFLADSSSLIPHGYNMGLAAGGDFWVVNSGTTQAVPGQKAYANLSGGLATFAATATPATASATGVVAAETSSVTGSIAGNILTVTAVASGTLYPGTTISGTNVASGTQIASQINGTSGGIGTYYVSIPEQAVASTTISGTYGQLTISGSVTGTIVLGALLSGTNVAAGTYITAFGTGAGGDGTYIVNNNTAVSSTTITMTTNVETKWIAMSSALAGELVKISSWPLG